MFSYIWRRVATVLVLMVLVTLITFLLLSPSFENVARSALGGAADEAAVAAKMAELGYDRPLFVQYGDWLWNAVQGDFGTSVFNGTPVVGAVVQRVGVTLSLIGPAILITAAISVLLGVWAASRGGVADRAAQGASLIGSIIPGLLLAIVLVFVFAVTLRWLPATGYVAPSDDIMGWLRSITMPLIVLVVASTASMTAQVRGAMIGELRKDYIRTLRTRGVSSSSIVLKHALRNAASPAFTVFSLEFAAMFGGAMIIENIFGLPGIGYFAYNASLRGDVPVILATTVFAVILGTGVNLIADIVNAWLNPKVKLS